MKFHIIFESVDPREHDRARDIVKTLIAFVDDADFVTCPRHQCVTVRAIKGQENGLRRALYSHIDDYHYDRDDAAGVISFDVISFDVLE